MKFSVSSYSFSRLMNDGGMTQLDCVEKAKELGFDAIEFVDILPHDGTDKADYADKLKAACDAAGLFVSNYTIHADLLKGDLDEEVARVCKEIDLGKRLGATSVRHDACWGYPEGTRGFHGFEDALPRLAEGCRRITEYAETLGIRTMIENHGFFCQESQRVEKLVNAVAHPNFGLLCDMGNFLCADEAPEQALGRVAPYAFYVHAKDFLWKDGNGFDPGEGFFRTRAGHYLRGTVVGHGVVPVKQCLDILKANGYEGNIAIEFEGHEMPLEAIATGLNNLKRFAAMANFCP